MFVEQGKEGIANYSVASTAFLLCNAFGVLFIKMIAAHTSTRPIANGIVNFSPKITANKLPEIGMMNL